LSWIIDPRFYERCGPLSAAALVQGEGRDAPAALGANTDGLSLDGDSAQLLSTAADLASAGPDAISFFDGKGPLPETAAGLVFIKPGTPTPHRLRHTVLAVCAYPRAAFAAAVGRLIVERSQPVIALAPDALVAPGVRIGPGAVLGAGVQIGAGAEIGPHVVLGPGVAVGRGSKIGANSVVQCALIGDHVTIGPGVMIGQAGFGVTQGAAGLVDLPHLGRVIIQDGVTIGANSAIDRGMLADTILAEQVKLDNLCHIAHNVVVGRQVRMAAFGGISGSTTIGDRALLAGRVGVVDHAVIGADAILAAGSAVLQDVPAGEVWCGYPAKPRMQWLREVAWLARAARKRNADQS
jgi:UDP-3-O-[3-hydroxymyristoyl] glucosamine N-acyltransferase